MKTQKRPFTTTNTLPRGVFRISIDDGYVEYQYHVRLGGEFSIAQIEAKISEILGRKLIEKGIRVS